MTQISKKDIIAFSRVLSELAESIGREPEIILDLIANKKPGKSIKPTSSIVTEPVISDVASTINLFEDFKGKDKDTIFDALKELHKNDLLFLIKKYNLGYTRLKSQETIADYIADLVSKRNTDVFIKQK
ncbi:hypothetical protein PXW75_25220 [Klebsiella pneumoniae]|uniref:hypothetical protein n=1 Tax=Enterobacteriaceae TaxID=543 RepID=UPI002381921A|nr:MULTISPECIES: hypothetical protein [Enterobacteriaceae]MDE4847734.1 hypothetical protein [Klebsiella pneumoniae]MDF7761450.1 hypothetical protein [Kosakonia cowanii]HBQ5785143.1 hypothetical protein [Klebsiella pneumoniae subsp. pneumoniae]HEE5101342.1 hypothetical protein [Klebsiella pneumoniae]